MLLASSGPAPAQFSPGPLSRAHAELEGTRNCSRCHRVGSSQGMEEKCLECHGGIKRLIDARRGLHGRIDHPACGTCHTEHSGRDYQPAYLPTLRPGSFNHDETGWPLGGKHLEQKCEACHKPERQATELLALEPAGDGNHPWIGLDPTCGSCHADPHSGRLGGTCSDCHDETSFHQVPPERFSHARTRYPLVGAHGRVECARCHDPVTGWGKTPAFARCDACHADAHAGKAALAGQRVDCGECHSVEAFAPSTFTAAMHRSSGFPLERKHGAVACAQCHPKNPKDAAAADLGTSGILLRPRHDRCGRCHADPHADQLVSRADGGDCAACHETKGWLPTTMQRADHDLLPFRLEGRHGEVECRSCHGSTLEGGLPVPDKQATGPAGVWFRHGEGSCLTCHIDAHDGTYAGVAGSPGTLACPDCHSFRSFAGSSVDVEKHAQFRYPLEGAHRAVPCTGCHRDLGRPSRASTLVHRDQKLPPIRFGAKHGECADCHRDPHRGQLAGSCARCHDLGAFRPASRFDHDTGVAFSLRGAHSKVPCERCHRTEIDPGGATVTIYKPLPLSCEGCHLQGLGNRGSESDAPMPPKPPSTPGS